MEQKVREVFRDLGPVQEVWLPAWEDGGHDHHNLIATVGRQEFTCQINRYLTYTNAGKSKWGVPVGCNGSMVHRKLQALLCYESQFAIDELGCWPHFMRDQMEYLAA